MAELSAALEFFPLSSVAKVALTIEIRNRDSKWGFECEFDGGALTLVIAINVA